MILMTSNTNQEHNEGFQIFREFSFKKKNEMGFYFADLNHGMGMKMRDFFGISHLEFNAV